MRATSKINEVEKSHYAIAQKIKQLLMADAVPQNSSGISADDVGVQLRVNSDVMFRPGSIDLLPEGTKVLEAVLKLMNEYNLCLVGARPTPTPPKARPPFPPHGSFLAHAHLQWCIISQRKASSPRACAQ